MIYVIRYDVDKAMVDFQAHLLKYALQLREELLNEARQGMHTPEGAKDLNEGEIKMAVGFISASIVGGAWAVMDEWGKGSKMDPNNPALDEYKRSGLWNPARHDHAIRGRPKGTYKDIFGRTQYSSGIREGVNLEHRYEPQQPSHALQTAQRWMMNGRFQWMLQKAVSSFPWGAYLKVGGKGV